LEKQLEALGPVMGHADELLHECDRLAATTTTVAAAAGDVAMDTSERCRYNTLMSCYHDAIGNVSRLIATTAESINKRDSLIVSYSPAVYLIILLAALCVVDCAHLLHIVTYWQTKL